MFKSTAKLESQTGKKSGISGNVCNDTQPYQQ